MPSRCGSIARSLPLWRLLPAAALLVASLNTLADDVYKTVDAQGAVVFSDHPLSSASKLVSVQVTAPNQENAARLTKEQALQNADAAQQAQQLQRDSQELQKKAAQEATQKQRCDAARNRYAVFSSGGRIFKGDDQGNRVYYSDQEIDQQRAITKAAMDSACSR
jgi:hypothetical protein